MAVAGHDLKQPLQVILMVLDNLAAKLTPTDRAFADIAISEIRHLSRGLDDLALAAQLEPVALVLPALAPLNAQALLDEIAGSWRLHAQVKGLSVAVRANVKTVFSNRDLVCAVLRNLVGNAIKYTDSGGVLVSCRKRAGQIRLEVWDSGPGIDALHLKAILQPYYQADPTRGGLGLGLVIAQIAAAQLSGRIEVATRPGVGSRFTLCLPATETTG
jgi:signal transduction histidine kinase